MAFSSRSILRMWWTTAPALVGYPDTPSQRADAEASLLATTPFRGTPRAVLAEVEKVQRNVGQGVFLAVYLRTAAGATVSMDDVRSVVFESDFRADERRMRRA